MGLNRSCSRGWFGMVPEDQRCLKTQVWRQVVKAVSEDDTLKNLTEFLYAAA